MGEVGRDCSGSSGPTSLQGDPGAHCTWLHPGSSWIFPVRETPESLWKICSSAQSAAQWSSPQIASHSSFLCGSSAGWDRDHHLFLLLALRSSWTFLSTSFHKTYRDTYSPLGLPEPMQPGSKVTVQYEGTDMPMHRVAFCAPRKSEP